MPFFRWTAEAQGGEMGSGEALEEANARSPGPPPASLGLPCLVPLSPPLVL